MRAQWQHAHAVQREEVYDTGRHFPLSVRIATGRLYKLLSGVHNILLARDECGNRSLTPKERQDEDLTALLTGCHGCLYPDVLEC